MTKSKMIVVNNETEKFSPSDCNCSFCLSTALSNEEWKTFEKLPPKNNVQSGMIKIVKKIENDISRREKDGLSQNDYHRIRKLSEDWNMKASTGASFQRAEMSPPSPSFVPMVKSGELRRSERLKL